MIATILILLTVASIIALLVYDVLAYVFHIGPTISGVIQKLTKMNLALAITIEAIVFAGLLVLSVHLLGVF